MLNTREEIKEYLDNCIKYWREDKRMPDERSVYYIDAYQSVRVSIFDEQLPQDSEEEEGN